MARTLAPYPIGDIPGVIGYVQSHRSRLFDLKPMWSLRARRFALLLAFPLPTPPGSPSGCPASCWEGSSLSFRPLNTRTRDPTPSQRITDLEVGANTTPFTVGRISLSHEELVLETASLGFFRFFLASTLQYRFQAMPKPWHQSLQVRGTLLALPSGKSNFLRSLFDAGLQGAV